MVPLKEDLPAKEARRVTEDVGERVAIRDVDDSAARTIRHSSPFRVEAGGLRRLVALVPKYFVSRLEAPRGGCGGGRARETASAAGGMHCGGRHGRDHAAETPGGGYFLEQIG